MTRLFFLLLFPFLLVSCGDAEPAKQTDGTPGALTSETPEQSPDAATPATTPPAFEPGALPPLPVEQADELVKSCDAVDVIFYHLGISMNMTDPPSIYRALRFIGAENPKLPPSCQPAGRFFYLSDGENILEADFYLSNGCLYFVFMEQGKPAYGNIMTDEGVLYFNNVLRQAGLLGADEAITR